VALKLNNLAEVVRINENEPGSKGANYFSRTKDGKQILRDVMNRNIPADVAKAEKQGFSGPDASWFKGESIDFVRRILLNDDAHIFKLLDRDAVRRLVEQHLNGEQNRRLLIWSLLNVEMYLNQNAFYQ
jgi:asparagine synthase (glutamine-hydrolysing)